MHTQIKEILATGHFARNEVFEANPQRQTMQLFTRVRGARGTWLTAVGSGEVTLQECGMAAMLPAGRRRWRGSTPWHHTLRYTSRAVCGLSTCNASGTLPGLCP